MTQKSECVGVFFNFLRVLYCNSIPFPYPRVREALLIMRGTRYKSLSPDEALIYSYIDSSQREGIWTRTLAQRSNLHRGLMAKCLKSLESKGLIKAIKSVKYPTRKIYMLAHLIPSED